MSKVGSDLLDRESSTALPSRAWGLVKVLRPYQWVKNLLLFVPLLLAHQAVTQTLLAQLALGFVAFSLCASAIYVINDLGDLESDRRHPHKKHRPFASGTLPFFWGPCYAVTLLVVAFTASAAFLPLNFTGLLAVYVVLNALYSFFVKRVFMLDVLLLAGLYTLRLVAGGAVTQLPDAGPVEVSQWLLAFGLFLFLSLAFSKRYVELQRLEGLEQDKVHGRGYLAVDLSLIETLGPTSGYIAVLVLALYINSEQLRRYYSHAWAIWLICPVILYWVSRIWFLAKRGQLDEDPVVYSFHDPVSLLLGVVVGVLFLLAR